MQMCSNFEGFPLYGSDMNLVKVFEHALDIFFADAHTNGLPSPRFLLAWSMIWTAVHSSCPMLEGQVSTCLAVRPGQRRGDGIADGLPSVELARARHDA